MPLHLGNITTVDAYARWRFNQHASVELVGSNLGKPLLRRPGNTLNASGTGPHDQAWHHRALLSPHSTGESTVKQPRTLVLSIGLLASMPVMAADIAGGQSPAQDGVHYINAGESTLNAGPHRSGRAGISLGPYANAARVDVASLCRTPPRWCVAQPVHTLGPDAGLPFATAGVGHFSFVQVGNADVWFGEWSSSGAQAGFNHRQVFFVGDRAGTSLPARHRDHTLAGIQPL